MRYFLNLNATLPVNVGGYSIQFETFRAAGGAWVGLVAADGRRADLLGKMSAKRIKEITLQEYEAEKKRWVKGKTPASRGSRPLPEPTQDLPPGTAPAAASAAEGEKPDITEVLAFGKVNIRDDLAESMEGRNPSNKKVKKYIAPSDKV